MAIILIVDDDRRLCGYMQELFSTKGHQVYTASNGKLGIKLFLEIQPDIIFTDIVMPEMEGIEFISLVHKENPDIQIIAMSGYGVDCGQRYLGYARSLGAHAVIPKPFNTTQLLNLVAGL